MEHGNNQRERTTSLQSSISPTAADVNYPPGPVANDMSFMYHPFMQHMMNMYVGAAAGTFAQ
ncbi:hypothetical protein KC19_4G223800 [Ceratodon purpureus]|uniref:Uncharacterized protein n=1 Tax=Ceratodon purpureus TaxID=3225 RepID=A0A8T0IDX0_CERPU|nr:hypothetical protein KC19_4G223800 [Ceratodon purpureus]